MDKLNYFEDFMMNNIFLKAILLYCPEFLHLPCTTFALTLKMYEKEALVVQCLW